MIVEQGGKSVEELIKKKFSGQAEKLMLLLCSSIISKPKFYARLIEDTMKGLGTKEDELNHVIARCREPALMGHIKLAYLIYIKKLLKVELKVKLEGIMKNC